MAFLSCEVFSESLGFKTPITAIIPQYFRYKEEEKHPTLYLLHGFAGGHTCWLSNTAIERYVESTGLAVIMPDAGRSYYTDMVHGYKYWTYISEELPKIARTLFPLSEKREDNFIAGLSMGGYGAFKTALNNPYKYAAAASLSGPLDISEWVLNGITADERREEWKNIFGDLSKIKGSSNDTIYLLEKLVEERKDLPKLYQCCGTEDFLYKNNTSYRDFVKELSVDLAYDEGPGIHDWVYWDQQIQKVLRWLPIR